MDCRITLSQINPTLGNLTKNLELHVAEIEAAKSAGSQLVLFPELSLSGYFLKDQTSEIALRLDSPLLKGLAEQSRKISIAAGFVERSPEGRLYNSIGFFEDGALLHVHRKVHLVTYGMFDEQREFAAGVASQYSARVYSLRLANRPAKRGLQSPQFRCLLPARTILRLLGAE